MQTQELLCFGAVAGEGNPALVIQHGPAGPAERQALATRAHRPASVFLDQVANGPVLADYYYPHARSPLCLHATLAAAQVLFAAQGHPAPITLSTALRGQPLHLTQEGALLFIALTPQPVAAVTVDLALARTLLGAPALALCAAPRVASAGSPKLLLEVADREALYALRPPLPRIVDWGRAHGVNGCYVYCRIGEGVYEGRNFNHLDAALEDGATGVAAAALSLHLGQGLRLHQGRASGRDCVIHTRIDGDSVLVGGSATVLPTGAH